MPKLDEFHAFKATSEDSDSGRKVENGSNLDFGLGWIVIAIVVLMLLLFIISGASVDAIDTLLGLGFLAFLFAKSLFR